MTLPSGKRLGPYELIAPIGAGGMGEVYKAKDTRLDRTVAVKVLPEELAQEGERRERLAREARAVSKLSHPHICAFHDIGRENGVDFLMLEYLERETLPERLPKRRLRIDAAIRYATEIADALASPHRGGVVHRDLKPRLYRPRTGTGAASSILWSPATLTAEPTKRASPGCSVRHAAPRDC
jgi:serine/threonine protein kinase